ncbi:MAG: hypothetical protein Q9212_006077, partial [Teloschistes hypoglaucus]
TAGAGVGGGGASEDVGPEVPGHVCPAVEGGDDAEGGGGGEANGGVFAYDLLEGAVDVYGDEGAG